MRFALLLNAAVALTGCGYVGDPLPPALNIPLPVGDLRVIQRGDKLMLDYTAPSMTTEMIGLTSLSAAEAQVGDKVVAMDVPKPGEAAHAELAAREWMGHEVGVRVILAGPKGRKSEVSNMVTLRVGEPLSVPSAVKAEPHPEGVRVSWTSPDSRAAKFRVTRSPEATAEVEKPEYIDRDVESGKEYKYSVIALSDTLESLPSEAAPVIPRDTFAPPAPANVNAIAGVNTIELAWDRSAAADWKSYRVYRDDQVIAPDLTSPSYSDKQIMPGRKYRYTVTAIDQVGNESDRSTLVEITAP